MRHLLRIKMAASISIIFLLIIAGCSSTSSDTNENNTGAKNEVAAESVSSGISGTMFRANPAHTGEYKSSGVLPNGNVKWKFSLNEYHPVSEAFAPAFDNGTVFVTGVKSVETTNANRAGKKSVLLAVDENAGTEKWRMSFDGKVGASVAAVDGVVYLATYTNESSANYTLHAINAANGAEIWKQTQQSRYNNNGDSGTAPSSVVVADGTVFLSIENSATDGKIFAFETKTGEKKWESDRLSVEFLVDGGRVYCGSSKVLLAESGELIPDLRFGYYAPDTISDGLAISTDTSDSGAIVAADATTGEEKWNHKISLGDDDYLHGSDLVAANGDLYVPSKNALHGLDINTGNDIWTWSISNSGINSSNLSGVNGAAISDGIIYISTTGGLYAINANSGTQSWMLPSTTELHGTKTNESYWGDYFCAPAVDNGLVFIQSDNSLLAVQ